MAVVDVGAVLKAVRARMPSANKMPCRTGRLILRLPSRQARRAQRRNANHPQQTQAPLSVAPRAVIDPQTHTAIIQPPDTYLGGVVVEQAPALALLRQIAYEDAQMRQALIQGKDPTPPSSPPCRRSTARSDGRPGATWRSTGTSRVPLALN